MQQGEKATNTTTKKKSKACWADTMEETQRQEQQAATATAFPLFALTNNESPFLIGVRGRNISLIRKYTGMLITIDQYVVHMSPIRHNHDFQLAWRMVFSASYGGILRWFETPQATKRGYPRERWEELEQLASTMNFSLDLLRSRRGHMCLILIPQIKIEKIGDSMTDSEIEEWKASTIKARETMLQALNVAA